MPDQDPFAKYQTPVEDPFAKYQTPVEQPKQGTSLGETMLHAGMGGAKAVGQWGTNFAKAMQASGWAQSQTEYPNSSFQANPLDEDNREKTLSDLVAPKPPNVFDAYKQEHFTPTEDEKPGFEVAQTAPYFIPMTGELEAGAGIIRAGTKLAEYSPEIKALMAETPNIIKGAAKFGAKVAGKAVEEGADFGIKTYGETFDPKEAIESTKTGAEIGAGFGAAGVTFNAIRGPVAEWLKKTAREQYLEFLRPSGAKVKTQAMKAVIHSDEESTVSYEKDAVGRGLIVGSPEKARKAAKFKYLTIGKQIDARYAELDKNVQFKLKPLYDDIWAWMAKNGMSADGSIMNQKVMDIGFKQMEELAILGPELGAASPSKIRFMRDLSDKLGKTYTTTATGVSVKATIENAFERDLHKVMADSMRDILNKGDATLEKLNKEHEFWRTYADLLRARKKALSGAQPLLNKRLLLGVGKTFGGGVVGGYYGHRQKDASPWQVAEFALAGAAGALALTTALESPLWNTTKPVVKDRIANLLASGNGSEAGALALKALANETKDPVNKAKLIGMAKKAHLEQQMANAAAEAQAQKDLAAKKAFQAQQAAAKNTPKPPNNNGGGGGGGGTPPPPPGPAPTPNGSSGLQPYDQTHQVLQDYLTGLKMMPDEQKAFDEWMQNTPADVKQKQLDHAEKMLKYHHGTPPDPADVTAKKNKALGGSSNGVGSTPSSAAPHLTDQKWMEIKAKGFTKVGPAHVGGAKGGKEFWTDSEGKTWLFKPAPANWSEAIPHAEEAAYKIARLINPDAVEVRHIGLDGKIGTIQRFNNNTVNNISNQVYKLSPKQIAQLQKEQVVDWMIGNHDAHAGQFPELSNGDLLPIDKGQAFKFTNAFSNAEVLHPDYHPNEVYGEDYPIYHYLHTTAKNGEIKLNPKATLEAIAAAQKIPDSEIIAAIKPYADALFDGYEGPKANFIQKVLDKKKTLLEDFQKYYADVPGMNLDAVKPAGKPAGKGFSTSGQPSSFVKDAVSQNVKASGATPGSAEFKKQAKTAYTAAQDAHELAEKNADIQKIQNAVPLNKPGAIHITKTGTITYEEAESVNWYKGPGATLNQTLYTHGELTDHNKTTIKNLDSVIAKHTLTYKTVLLRGLHGDYAKWLKTLKVGDIFENLGYSSTSSKQFIADNFGSSGVVLSIEAEAGTPVYPYGYGDSEKEMLLARGLRKRVKAIEFNGPVPLIRIEIVKAGPNVHYNPNKIY